MIIATANRISRFFYQKAFGLALLRIATGLVFLLHGWMKVREMAQTVFIFGHLGFPAPVAYFIAWLEVIGGLALILGIATRLFALLFAIEMLVAVFVIGLSRAFGGFEFYLSVASLAIALIGSGRFSILKMECDNCGGFLCGRNADICTAVKEDITIV